MPRLCNAGIGLALLAAMAHAQQPDVLARLIAGPDDDRLIDAVSDCVSAFERQRGYEELPDPVKTFVRVFHLGVIYDNGGFQYFLERTEDFAETVRDLHNLRLRKQAQAVQEVLDLFPKSTPHRDWEARMAFLGVRPGWEDRLKTENPGVGFQELLPALADHVRKHAKVFRALPQGKLRLQPEAKAPGSDASISAVLSWLRSLDKDVWVKVGGISGSKAQRLYSDDPLPEQASTLHSIRLPERRRDATRTLELLSAWQGSAEIRELQILVQPAYLPRLAPLERLTGLHILQLSCAGLQDEHLAPLARLNTLRQLHLEAAEVTAAGLTKILAEQQGLEQLSLRGIRGAFSLPDLPRLKQLTLTGVQISEATAGQIAGCKTLEDLRVWHCPGTSALPGALRGHPRLRRLSLEGVVVGEAEARALADLPRLRSLHVDAPRPDKAAVRILAQAHPDAELSIQDR